LGRLPPKGRLGRLPPKGRLGTTGFDGGGLRGAGGFGAGWGGGSREAPDSKVDTGVVPGREGR
jgi:hypothetical protein